MANAILYGYLNQADLASQRVTSDLIPVINTAITQATAERERQLRTLMSLFVERTGRYTERYTQSSIARLQPMDDNGRARPIKPAGYYDVAYPILHGGTARGADYITRVKTTVDEVARHMDMLFGADTRWMRDHVLAALFASTSWTFPDPIYGNLTVRSLANGDAVTYYLMSGADTAATATNQLAQANAIGSGADNPYPTIYSNLLNHPENGGKVIALISTSLKATTQALATFNPLADPNIRVGASSDVLVGDLGVEVPGRVLGYEDSGVWVVEWPFLPSGYIVAVTSEGPRALAMREDPEPELQGFRFAAEREDYPYWEQQWFRRAGFGARNRVGALVYRIGSGSYAVPTGYDSPMP